MNPPKPPPTKKELVRTAASSYGVRLWVLMLVLQPVILLAGGVDIQRVVTDVAYFLLGSVVTFTAMKVR